MILCLLNVNTATHSFFFFFFKLAIFSNNLISGGKTWQFFRQSHYLEEPLQSPSALKKPPSSSSMQHNKIGFLHILWVNTHSDYNTDIIYKSLRHKADNLSGHNRPAQILKRNWSSLTYSYNPVLIIHKWITQFTGFLRHDL